MRWIGGLIQAAFAPFWLVRGSAALGGSAAGVLIAVFGVIVIAVFLYAAKASGGTAPRPRSAEGKRIELAVTIATVIEFAAAIALPVIGAAAGHSDWVLPSIAITIGPLLLWLDQRVHVLLLGTALAGFHDLAGVRRAEQGRAGTAAVSVSAGAQR